MSYFERIAEYKMRPDMDYHLMCFWFSKMDLTRVYLDDSMLD
jgi:hypothetical protein